MQFTVSGTTYKKNILARVAGRVDVNTPGTRVQLLDMGENPITGNQAPGGVATPGWVLQRLYGAFSYSPA